MDALNRGMVPSASNAQVELSAAVALAVDGLVDNLERSRNLVRDAIAKLLSGFSTLSGAVGQQQTLLHSISERLRVNGEQGSFTGTTIALVHTFVEQVVRVSHESMRIIDELDRTRAHVETIVKHADKIECLAGETRLIALNARIETGRAGDAGRTFKVVAEEVKRLAVTSSELSIQIRREVDDCNKSLERTHQTAATLAGHDMTSTIESRGTIVSAIEKLAEVNSALDVTLHEIGQRVDDAVRALQFEDMLSQLLGDTIDKLRRLSTLTGQALTMPPAELASHARVEELCESLRALGRTGSVSQSSVSAGSIELF